MNLLKPAGIILLVALSFLSALGEGERPLYIAITAQTAGAIFPCRCPMNPEGGLAARAAFFDRLRSEGELVAIDAGGWMPGGILDEYAGDAAELEKRAAVLAGAYTDVLRYDVVALAPQDLAKAPPSGIQYVSGNLPMKDGRESAITKGVFTFTVMPENAGASIYPPRPDLKALPPLQFALKQVETAKAAGARIVVMLSALSEPETVKLVRAVKGINLAVASNPRSEGRHSYKVGDTTIATVPVQGRAVGVWSPASGYRLEYMGPSQLVSAEATKYLAARGYASPLVSRLTMDFFVMSRCPYGRPALPVVLEAAARLKGFAVLNLYFVVSVDKAGKLQSLHGEDELEDNRRMLAVYMRKPEALADYLQCSSAEGFDFAKWLTDAGIDPWKVKASLDCGEVDAELRSHAARCSALGVNASPTLKIGNTPFNGEFTVERLLFEACRRLSGSEGISACRNLPKCFSDIDCAEFGFITICDNSGKANAACRKIRDIDVNLIVIKPPDAVADPSEQAVTGMTALLPSLKIREVVSESGEGRALIARHGIERLPAFVFGPEVVKAYNYKRMADVLKPSAGAFVATPESVFSNWYVLRPAKPGEMILFALPYGERGAALITRAVELSSEGFPLPELRFPLLTDEEGRLVSARGIGELEECARMRAAFALDSAKAVKYLLARCAHPGSSYWDDDATAAGFDPTELKKAARSEETTKLLAADAELAAAFGTPADAFMLLGNRELVFIQDAFDLEITFWCSGVKRQ
ncbi:MAG: hypothetical protein WC712_01215 [Candidatus Brocadiia bacterium]